MYKLITIKSLDAAGEESGDELLSANTYSASHKLSQHLKKDMGQCKTVVYKSHMC